MGCAWGWVAAVHLTVQHIAHDLVEKRGKSESNAIQMAIGIVKRWARGGGNVDAGTQAAAAKAVAEWERLKAGAGGGKLRASLEPSFAEFQAVRDAALARVAMFEQAYGVDGMVALIELPLQEADAGWKPEMKRTASASSELTRHEVHDSGQHVGTITKRAAYSPRESPRYSAIAVNGDRVGEYGISTEAQALDALKKHLEEAPARVAPHRNGKWLVARPASYSGQTSYMEFPNEPTARHAAGLPAVPSTPEKSSQVDALGEMLTLDLLTLSGESIPPLRRVQEARRRVPFGLTEGFNPSEVRDFHGRWSGGGHRAQLRPQGLPGRSTRVGRPKSPSQVRYDGGVVRASAGSKRPRQPQIPIKKLGGSIGKGRWSKSADQAVKDMTAGKVKSTEHAHRAARPDGTLGPYAQHRIELHQQILRSLFQGKGTHEGSARAVFTAGGPASGKSALIKAGHIKLPSDAVHINPDIVREMLPEYQALKAAGHKDASTLTHEEASHIAKLALNAGLALGHHVVVDTVGDSEPQKFARKVMLARKAGHRVSVHYATSSVSEALKRSEKRFRDTGRHVPEKFLRDAHRSVSQRFPEVARIPGIHLQVFDTNGPPKLIAERKPDGDKIRIADKGAVDAFLRKGKG